MNLYELGKDMRAITTAVQSLDQKLSDLANAQCQSSSSDQVNFNIPCVPSRVETRDFEFAAKIRSATLVSNTARNGDYLMAMVTSTPIYKTDSQGNQQEAGTNIYLGVKSLQPMALLGQMLYDQMFINYGFSNYPDMTEGLPLMYGLKAEWSPQRYHFTGGAGLLTMLSAYVDRGCGFYVRAAYKPSFDDAPIFFRAGNHAPEKLGVLALAYQMGVNTTIPLEEIRLTGPATDLVLDRVKLP